MTEKIRETEKTIAPNVHILEIKKVYPACISKRKSKCENKSSS